MVSWLAASVLFRAFASVTVLAALCPLLSSRGPNGCFSVTGREHHLVFVYGLCATLIDDMVVETPATRLSAPVFVVLE